MLVQFVIESYKCECDGECCPSHERLFEVKFTKKIPDSVPIRSVDLRQNKVHGISLDWSYSVGCGCEDHNKLWFSTIHNDCLVKEPVGVVTVRTHRDDQEFRFSLDEAGQLLPDQQAQNEGDDSDDYDYNNDNNDSDSDSYTTVTKAITQRQNAERILRGVLQNTRAIYDDHWDCYCKTRNVCGCGCDPRHDGW
jgi:hypothetical protein